MTNFILEQSPSCAKDSVAVYEGNRILQGKIGNMILQDKICGSVSSSLSWTSKDNKVLLVFQADVSNSNSGFKGYFSEMKKRMFDFEMHVVRRSSVPQIFPSESFAIVYFAMYFQLLCVSNDIGSLCHFYS